MFIHKSRKYRFVSDSEMSNFFVEQGRTRVCGEAYSMYVAAGNPRRTPSGGKRAIYGWTLTSGSSAGRITSEPDAAIGPKGMF